MKKLLFFLSFSTAISQPLFELWKTYPVENGPYSVFAADLDSDGDPDLVVGYYFWDDFNPDTVISVLMNNGNGTFAPRVNYQTGKIPIDVSGSDLDGDGDIDLVVVNQGIFDSPDSTVSVLMNNGDGTFARKVDYVAGRRPTSVVASDFDKDGDEDLAISSFDNGTIAVLKNRGDGSFEPKVDYPVGHVLSLAVADLDGDGNPDLVAANQGSLYVPCSGGSAAVLKNSGNGTFGTKVDYPSAYPVSVSAADLDGDGAPDLITTNSGFYCFQGSTVSVFKNYGNGTFAAKVDYAPQQDPSSVFAADFDGDGDVDLAVANYGICFLDHCLTGDFVSVFLNNGDGTFALEANYPTGNDPAAITGGDFDGDGDVDLAVVNYHSKQVQILLNNAAPFYSKGDIDGDGAITSLDVILLINCVFAGSGDCKYHGSSDVNCDGHLSPIDMVLELRALFLNIPFPC